MYELVWARCRFGPGHHLGTTGYHRAGVGTMTESLSGPDPYWVDGVVVGKVVVSVDGTCEVLGPPGSAMMEYGIVTLAPFHAFAPPGIEGEGEPVVELYGIPPVTVI